MDIGGKGKDTFFLETGIGGKKKGTLLVETGIAYLDVFSIKDTCFRRNEIHLHQCTAV